MARNAVANRLSNAFMQFGRRRILARAFRKNGRDIVEADRLARSKPVHPLRMTGRQRADVPKQGERLGHAAEQFEADDTRRFRIARKSSAREQRLYLRSEAKRPSIVGRV